ncbi:hypothetical protein [Streptomyces sp. NPDC048442]|uniref:hypothetical protein n=1 Tax=Streptomyces sp. NPDC048442 TaxID=3154823 RepID=UPI00341C0E7F
MADDRMPTVGGPFRIHAAAIPGGATLDISHYLSVLILALAGQADEDGQSVLDDLQHIAALDRSAGHQGPDSHAAHQRDTCVETLLDGLVSDGSIPVYGVQVLRLADRLREIGQPKAVPAQRQVGAA